MKRNLKSRLKTWLALVLSCLIMAVALGQKFYREDLKNKVDKDGCLKATPPSQLVLVLLDQSDPFDHVDRSKVISDAVTKRLSELQQYDRIVVMTPEADRPFAPQTVFSKCVPSNPGSPRSPLELLLTARKKTQNDWEVFEARLLAGVSNALQEEVQDQTPLIETFIAVAKDPELRGARKRVFLVFSDMLQNTQQLNFYVRVPHITGARDIGLPVETDFFKGTDVHIHHITRYQTGKRMAAHQRPEFRRRVKEFWDIWLTDQGARVSWSEMWVGPSGTAPAGVAEDSSR